MPRSAHTRTIQRRGSLSVSRASVLVVEDVPELSRLLELTFELDERFEPAGVANSAAAAVEMAATVRPHAVVLDMSIDDAADGSRLLRELRELLPECRIVVFTGHDDAARRDQMIAAGASAYVVKGGDLDELLEALSPSYRGNGAA